jgi:argininosuccinate synthase
MVGREVLQALVTETQRDVTGVVRLKLYKGNIIVACGMHIAIGFTMGMWPKEREQR